MADEKRSAVRVDLDSSREASVARLMQLKAGRNESDIPLDDQYWKALRKHMAAHAKGSLK